MKWRLFLREAAGLVLLTLAAACGGPELPLQQQPAPESDCPDPLVWPLEQDCAAEFAGMPMFPRFMSDDWAVVDQQAISITSLESDYGLSVRSDDPASLVLMDVWPRYQLRWYTPPPEGPARPPAGLQKLVVIHSSPVTSTVQFAFSTLEGPRLDTLDALQANMLTEWE